MEPTTDHIEFKTANGFKFKIRATANRKDQSELNIAMGEDVRIEDGKTIRPNLLKLCPWLIKRFVIGWSEGTQGNGTDILNALYDQPADPKEDVIIVLGTHIFLSVKGLTVTKEDEHKKKG